MFVQDILPAARARLVTLKDDAPLTRAAHLLGSGTDILAVCGQDGKMVGVITKTDVVKQIGICQGEGCRKHAAAVMTNEIMLCQSGDKMAELWARMKTRGIKNVPYVDDDARPVGMINARDLLQALLGESVHEETLTRDYIMGVGYR
jgi:predicted transcriptional regulator